MIAAGGRLIQDYGGFQIVEADEAQLGAAPSALPIEHRINDGFLELNAGRLATTLKPLPNAAGAGLHLVQLAGPPKPEWFAALKATGIRIISYVPSNGYLVKGDATAIARLTAHATSAPQVKFFAPYLPAYKVRGSRGGLTEWAVQMVEDAAENPATIALAGSRSAKAPRSSHALGYVNLIVSGDDALAALLAQRPDVVSIAPYQPHHLLDERQDIIVAGQLSGTQPTGPGYLAWLKARGFSQKQFDASGFGVDLSDSGIDNGTTTPNHFGLYTSGDVSQPGRIAYNRLEGDSTAGFSLAGCDGHGTINAHIIAGFGDRAGAPFADDAGYSYGLGVAPFVRVGSSVIFDPFVFTSPVYEDLQSRAYRAGMRISSNSWGSEDGNYDSDAQRYDALVRDAAPDASAAPEAGNQPMTIVFAAGNSGNGPSVNVRSPGNAKNVITVGASENVRLFGAPDQCTTPDSAADSALDVAFFSSAGPTFDGRAKPDLVAPGTHVTGGVAQALGQRATTPANPLGEALSCFGGFEVCGGTDSIFYPDGQQWYTASSGTSHSTPAVAGAAALLRQWFINHGLTPPSPAMTKAYLVNAARYMTGPADSLPSRLQGMGLLDLGAAFDDTQRLLRDQVAADLFTASGQTRVFSGTADPARPLRVTLAWTDAPGPTFASAWVNDLDLTVNIGGTTYRGNVFNGAFSVTGGLPDRVNNLESVFLPAGLSGPFTVTITAANIAGDGVPGNASELDQDFALVISNACADVAPASPTNLIATSGVNSIALNWSGTAGMSYAIERSSQGGPFVEVAQVSAPTFRDSGVSGAVVYSYRVKALAGCARSEPSDVVVATPSGACLTTPVFSGLDAASSTGAATCGATLTWNPATPRCGGVISYDVFRSTDPQFFPSPQNRVANVSATSFLDEGGLLSEQTYLYIVRAVEDAGGSRVSDSNTAALAVVPSFTETLFFDDFDQNRPPQPASHWIAGSSRGAPSQLAIVSGCRAQSGTSAYRFGGPGCDPGYQATRSGGTVDFSFSSLLFVGDGPAEQNGFFIPPDVVKATLTYRHWLSFHFDPALEGFDEDGVTLFYSTTSGDNTVGAQFQPVPRHAFASPPFTGIIGPQPWVSDLEYDGGLPGDLEGWIGADSAPGGEFREVQVHLEQMVNQAVWFEWLFETSLSETEEGFYLDDVRLEVQRTCSPAKVAPAAPARFLVSGLPAETAAFAPLSFTAQAVDAAGNQLSSYNGTGTVRSNDPYARFDQSITFVGGVATGTVQFGLAGRRSLEVLDAAGVARGVLTTVVADAPPASLRFLVQPASGPSFSNGMRFEVEVTNAFGAPVQDVTCLADLSSNPGGEAFTPFAVKVVNGRGFGSFAILHPGIGYRIVVVIAGVSAQTDPFNVTPGSASSLKATLPGPDLAACAPATGTVGVLFEDPNGNVASGDGLGPIELDLDGPAGTVVVDTARVGPQTDEVVLHLGSAQISGGPYRYRVHDQSGFMADVTGPAFNVVPGPAASMVLDQQPNSGVGGLPLNRSLKLHLLDACGNAGVTSGPRVSLALDPGLYPGVLTGVTSATPDAGGNVEFDTLSISRDGFYSIAASAPGVPTLHTAPFGVVAGPLQAYALTLASGLLVTGDNVLVGASAVDTAGDGSPYQGTASVTTDDPDATVPATVDFKGDFAAFHVTFHSTGNHVLTLTEVGGPLRGSVSVFVTNGPAKPAPAGGCSSAGGEGFLALLAFAVARRSRRHSLKKRLALL